MDMTQTAAVENRKTALFARTSTRVLLVSMTALGAVESPSEEERMTHAWVCDEIERRHPEVSAALETAFDVASAEEERTGEYVDVDYDQVIRDSIEL